MDTEGAADYLVATHGIVVRERERDKERRER